MYTVGLDVATANRGLAILDLFPSLVIKPRNIKKSGTILYHPTRRYLQSTVVPSLPSRLDPFFVTGFTDAEGSFILSINKSTRYKVGWSVVACYQIVLNIKDVDILYRIQEYFEGVGSVTISKDRAIYMVNGHSDLIKVILPHFDAVPLITKKQADYILFRKALLDFIQDKKHLTLKGVEGLVAIRASMNLGLKENLKKAFSSVVPLARPIIISRSVPHGMWMAGFVSGEGSFFVHARPNTTKITIFIKITQHKRDLELLKSFVEYFGCGRVYEPQNEEVSYYICEKLSDILDNIIPYFYKYPIQGVKVQNLADFVLIANLMKDKAHLTEEGYKKILSIKEGMNRGRK